VHGKGRLLGSCWVQDATQQVCSALGFAGGSGLCFAHCLSCCQDTTQVGVGGIEAHLAPLPLCLILSLPYLPPILEDWSSRTTTIQPMYKVNPVPLPTRLRCLTLTPKQAPRFKSTPEAPSAPLHCTCHAPPIILASGFPCLPAGAADVRSHHPTE
jgi:hypothetical protein